MGVVVAAAERTAGADGVVVTTGVVGVELTLDVVTGADVVALGAVL
ncbi:MAG: hypothetical protein AAGA87_14360 [Pseudomonadota bacterium]